MSMWSLRWHFTNKSVTGAPYSINSYSLSHSWTLRWRVWWLKQCRLEVVAELQQLYICIYAVRDLSSGCVQLTALDFKTSEFVSVHSKPIRDLAFHARTSDATMLSCSMDKSIKLTSLHSNNVLQTYVQSCFRFMTLAGRFQTVRGPCHAGLAWVSSHPVAFLWFISYIISEIYSVPITKRI